MFYTLTRGCVGGAGGCAGKRRRKTRRKRTRFAYVVRSRCRAAFGTSLFYTYIALYCIYTDQEFCKSDVLIIKSLKHCSAWRYGCAMVDKHYHDLPSQTSHPEAQVSLWHHSVLLVSLYRHLSLVIFISMTASPRCTKAHPLERIRSSRAFIFCSIILHWQFISLAGLTFLALNAIIIM